tara:strand:- start:4 stop:603 length:600 start_codon:yes stop_codon:yes gene_type:complete
MDGRKYSEFIGDYKSRTFVSVTICYLAFTHTKRYLMKKIAVFVDVQNIYYTVKDTFGCNFNYRKLWDKLSADGEIVVANAYAIDRNDPQQRGFQKALDAIGFKLKLKPFIQRSDGSAKGDWDVGIAIDVMDSVTAMEGPIDTVVLLSGDGDFDRLLTRVSQSNKVETVIYGVEALTAKSLIDAADIFEPIDENLLLKNK